MTKTEFPLLKEGLMKDFGYVSFQLVLANVDVVGIRIRKSMETVIITYRMAWKTGFFYEGGKLSREQQFRVFSDVPEDFNDLKEYEEKFGDKVEILVPPKHNYVFLNNKEVSKYVKPKKTTL